MAKLFIIRDNGVVEWNVNDDFNFSEAVACLRRDRYMLVGAPGKNQFYLREEEISGLVFVIEEGVIPNLHATPTRMN